MEPFSSLTSGAPHVRPTRQAVLSVDTSGRLFTDCVRRTSGDPPSVESSGFGSGAAGGFVEDPVEKRSCENLSLYSSATNSLSGSDSLCSIEEFSPNDAQPPPSVENVPSAAPVDVKPVPFLREAKNLLLPTKNGVAVCPAVGQHTPSSPAIRHGPSRLGKLTLSYRYPDDLVCDPHVATGQRSNTQQQQQVQLISSGLNRLSLRSPLAVDHPVATSDGVPDAAWPGFSDTPPGQQSVVQHQHHPHQHAHHHHHHQSALESIPQGQELEVTIASGTPGRQGGFCLAADQDTSDPGVGLTRATASSPVSPVCCPCRMAVPLGEPELPSRVPVLEEAPLGRSKCTASAMKRHSYPVSSREQVHNAHHDSQPNQNLYHRSPGFGPNSPPASSSTHWARDLVDRVKGNLSAMSNHYSKHHHHHHHQQGHHSQQANSGGLIIPDPDCIDPRRLPKVHGPTSASLQFASKPLHSLNCPSSVGVLGAPASLQSVAMLRSVAMTNSPGVGESSWKSQTTKGRFFSRTPSERTSESDQRNSTDLSDIARLSCSAVENIQEAMDILAERSQTSSRAAFRVRSASESEHVVVISKSLSRINEEHFRPDCAVGIFNEKHAYNTLFRHSTCYDILPNSGKLVTLDSRLGILPAIRALLENGAQAAVIWHTETHSVSGLFTQEFGLYLLVQHAIKQQQMLPLRRNEASLSDTVGYPLSSVLNKWGSWPLCDVVAHFCPGLASAGPISQRETEKGHRPDCHRHWHQRSFVSPCLDLLTALSRLLRSGQVDKRASGAGPSHKKVNPGGRTDATAAGNRSSDALFPVESLLTTHLIVMDSIVTGNVLGLLNADRLLAYLRVRIDDLPRPAHMSCPVGCLQGLRWSERWTSSGVFSRHGGTGATRQNRHHRRRKDRNRLASDAASEEGIGGHLSEGDAGRAAGGGDAVAIPPALLLPDTSCRRASELLVAWLPRLPCLPILAPSCETVIGAGQKSILLGLVNPGDMLNFILNCGTDSALKQPLSKLLELRPLQCRAQQDCICYTHEPIGLVLDRMFRLKTSCLVLVDLSKSSDGNSLGQPVGLVTAKDLLFATVVIPSSLHWRSKPRHKKNRSDLTDNHSVDDAGGGFYGGPPKSADFSRSTSVNSYFLLKSQLPSGSSSSSGSRSGNSSNSSNSACSSRSSSSCSCRGPVGRRGQHRAVMKKMLHSLVPEGQSPANCFCACSCHQSAGGNPAQLLKHHGEPVATLGDVVPCRVAGRSGGGKPTTLPSCQQQQQHQPLSNLTPGCHTQSNRNKVGVKSIPGGPVVCGHSSKRDEDDIVFRMD